MEKYFDFSKMDKNKCPKKISKNTLTEKIFLLDNENLSSQIKPSNKKNVIIFFKKILKNIFSGNNMETLGNQIQQNSAQRFYCKFCHYGTDRKCNYDTHIISTRHIRNAEKRTDGNQIQQKFSENSAYCLKDYVCENCNKHFQSKSGLWKHEKKCNIDQSSYSKTSEEEISDKQLIMMLIKDNSELKNLVIKVLENGTQNTMNNCHNTTNSHNKAFNLNFFLNETCKNAMNITDFVDSIKLQLTDFMDVGELGYVEGISNIIVKKLKDLDETVRPIHCTDQKRETFYVKDKDKWEKEEEDMKQIRKMIKRISYKNERLMSTYKEKYPDYNDPESKNSDKYSKFVIEALGGDGNNMVEKENKIIKHITKITTIKNKQ
jgi:hypothetical protein